MRKIWLVVCGIFWIVGGFAQNSAVPLYPSDSLVNRLPEAGKEIVNSDSVRFHTPADSLPVDSTSGINQVNLTRDSTAVPFSPVDSAQQSIGDTPDPAEKGNQLDKMFRDNISNNFDKSVEKIDGLINKEIKNLLDSGWKFTSLSAFTFNEVALYNWATGGDNTIAGACYLTFSLGYAWTRLYWESQLDLGYGMSKNSEGLARKSEDKIDMTTKIGWQVKNGSNVYYSFLFNFKSQFAPGYNYAIDSAANNVASHFLAPGYFTYPLGVDLKALDNKISSVISPVSGRTTFVNDDSLAEAGAYNVAGSRRVHNQLGAYLQFHFANDVMRNVNVNAKFEAFSNFLQKPQNIWINCEVFVLMKINDWISAALRGQVIYDDLTPVPLYEKVQGRKQLVGYGPRLQAKQVFGLCLSATLFPIKRNHPKQ